CHADNQRWPNTFFAAAGLFTLFPAWQAETHSRGKVTASSGEPCDGKPPARFGGKGRDSDRLRLDGEADRPSLPLSKIYLDMCCFNRPFDSQTATRIKLETEARLYIQSAVLDGKLALIWSFLLDYENSANPYPDHREAIAEWKTLSKHYIPALDSIRERGATIATNSASNPKTPCMRLVLLKRNVIISSPLIVRF
ncbi:MAG: hypothetical protein ACRERV_09860, partial [Methylococcales bacterium]